MTNLATNPTDKDDRGSQGTVFLADINEWAAMNKVCITYFSTNPPALSALGSSGLALGVRTEIECMATVQ